MWLIIHVFPLQIYIVGDCINCDNSEGVEAGIQKSMDGLSVLDVSIKRANQFKALMNQGNLDYNILSNLHHLGSPLGYRIYVRTYPS